MNKSTKHVRSFESHLTNFQVTFAWSCVTTCKHNTPGKYQRIYAQVFWFFYKLFSTSFVLFIQSSERQQANEQLLLWNIILGRRRPLMTLPKEIQEVTINETQLNIILAQW